MPKSVPKKKPATDDSGNFKVSQSKVSTWRRCRLAYHFAHVEQIAPKKKARPLKFGTIVHQMIEADNEGKNPFKVLKEVAKSNEKLFAEEAEMYGNIAKDIGYIMTAYFDYWDGHKDQYEYIAINGRKAEHEFAIEIADGITAKGKIDAFVKAKKLLWLGEHKSHKNFPKPEHRWRNLQSVVYIRITDMMGWGKLDGTCWDYIRSKSPTRPQVLKDGGLSKRALDSLPQVVLDVIKEEKLNKADYKEMIDEQTEGQKQWFQRIYTPISPHITQFVWGEFLATAREMSELHGKSKERTFGRHCEWCGYNPICRAELLGHDVDFVKEREFTHNDYEVVIEETDQD